jgi:aspartate/glutamate racemase
MDSINQQHHTTLVVVMSDGSHRTTNWYRMATWQEIKDQLKDYARSASKILWAVVLYGANTHPMQYTASEVEQLIKEGAA